MPESANSGEDGLPGRGVRPGRIVFLSLLAAAAGYYLASGAIDRLWRDGAGVAREFEIMRTQARIAIPADSGSGLAPSELADLAEKAIREVDALMSPRGEHSDIRRLNSAPAGTWVEVNPLTWEVVMEALRWHRLSGGAFDPTIGPVKRLFNFNQAETEDWPEESELAEARSRVGAEKLLFDREGMRLAWKVDGMSLDLGAIAKGFAVDRAAAALIARGVRNAIVDVGGELRLMGKKPGSPPSPWRTGVKHPRRKDILETLELSDAAVATSGDYENFLIFRGKRYEHIIDPRSGLPLAERTACVTVIHPDSCRDADALATTLCVLGPEEAGDFLESQALGLFSRGVRVIAISLDRDGGLLKSEFTIDQAGRFQASRSRLPE
ncbi:MAG: FAD:protein FMN transferase [Planctomycetota bacterium]|nr:FAD:protein FMN transferase [Planctomycetota bacterium]